jgi:hypothetical protein
MVYKIIHKECLVGAYYVMADSSEEALNKYWSLVNSGKIDFSDMEILDSSDEAVLVENE